MLILKCFHVIRGDDLVLICFQAYPFPKSKSLS